jgi:hypothetical protein
LPKLLLATVPAIPKGLAIDGHFARDFLSIDHKPNGIRSQTLHASPLE